MMYQFLSTSEAVAAGSCDVSGAAVSTAACSGSGSWTAGASAGSSGSRVSTVSSVGMISSSAILIFLYRENALISLLIALFTTSSTTKKYAANANTAAM